MASPRKEVETQDELLATSSGFQPRFAALALDYLQRLGWSVPGGYVLEVGCGHGDVTGRELLPRLPPHAHIVAADYSDAALAEAARRYFLPRVCFLPLHIEDRFIESTGVWRLGPYSAVFCFNLHWARNRRRALMNINKLLSPGGEAILLVVSDNSLASMNEALRKKDIWSNFLKGCPQFSTTEDPSDEPEEVLKTDLQKAGFSVETCCTRDAAFASTDIRDIKDVVLTINPYVSRIPRDFRKNFLQECIYELRKNSTLSGRLLTTETLYILKYDAIVVRAIKS